MKGFQITADISYSRRKSLRVAVHIEEDIQRIDSNQLSICSVISTLDIKAIDILCVQNIPPN
jgi:hypothetical protein